MNQELTQIEHAALTRIVEISDLKKLAEVEVEYLGRKGKVTLLFKELGSVSAEARKSAGQKLNEVKRTLEAALAEKKLKLEEASLQKNLVEEWVDVTAPGIPRKIGHIHPLFQVQYEVEQIFSDMGFEIADGPEVESEYYNFEGLNIPSWHPARDMQDTFFIEGNSGKNNEFRHPPEQLSPALAGPDSLRSSVDKKHGRLVLRTHTSPVQVRTMEKYGAPLRIIVPGRVFRNEATDARHEHTFDQVEGLMVDRHISLAHLKGVMQEFLTRLFGRSMKVRFRPGYFPFVEPGLELDISCTLCGEKGCRVCKRTGWLEFMGAGMVHPNVLRSSGIDPGKWQGWAFGFGLTRLTMMKFGIDDIRLLCGGDLRFLQQF